MSENLWPTDFGHLTIKTPISILREQGVALGQRTSNIVVGRPQITGQPTSRFHYVFYIYCSPLGYQVPLLTVEHGIALYPAEICVVETEEQFTANNAEEFTTHLKTIFSQEKTKNLIASLLAQSEQPVP